MNKLIFKTLAISWLSLASLTAQAQLKVTITGVGSNLYPIAVANFSGETAAAQQISTIIRADLARSGRFVNIDAGATPIAETEAIDLASWKTKGADAFVAGSVSPSNESGGNNKDYYSIRFRLSDTVKRQSLGGLALAGPAHSLRASAHKASDYIYQQLLGERGIFSTRIAYVVRTQNRYQLQVSDSDGQNPQIALASTEPIISPTWSPDGTKIAYVSFEQKKPVVYIHDLISGQRTVVANQRGSNSAPAWSPNGKQLAVALSLTGNTQIYLVNVDGSGLRRLSKSNSIDTEPQFSPNGESIYFTSDRGGSPQIYKMPNLGEILGGQAQRVTFQGRYNTTPRISPNGKLLAYISRINGGFKLHLQDLASNEVTSLTETRYDDSPSFAANSKYLLYATQANGRDVLATVSIDARPSQILSVRGSDVRDPSWGPFLQSSGE